MDRLSTQAILIDFHYGYLHISPLTESTMAHNRTYKSMMFLPVGGGFYGEQ